MPQRTGRNPAAARHKVLRAMTMTGPDTPYYPHQIAEFHSLSEIVAFV
jgi:hypothetical protein